MILSIGDVKRSAPDQNHTRAVLPGRNGVNRLVFKKDLCRPANFGGKAE